MYKYVKIFAIFPVLFLANVNIANALQGDVDVNPYTAVVVDRAATAHLGPKARYLIVEVFKKGQNVRVIAKNGAWLKVRLVKHKRLTRGYIQSSELKRKGGGVAQAGDASSARHDRNITDYIAKVTARALNVRSGPGSNYRKVGRSLPRNTAVRVTHSSRGSWVRIAYGSGKRAYVSGNFLRR